MLTFPALLISLYMSAQNNVHIEDASKHIGEIVTICDKIYEGDFKNNSRMSPTILKMGGVYPKHKMSILINYKDRKNFTDTPETYYVEKDVCITGKVIEIKGKPCIVVSKPTEIQIGTE
jgi:hypothetical protein